MSISEVSGFIFRRTIKSVDEFKNILNTQRTEQKFLGKLRLKKYLLPQDVFEAYKKDNTALVVPNKIDLKLSGKGDKSVDLIVPKDSAFTSKNGHFNYSTIYSPNVRLRETESLLGFENSGGKVRNVNETAEFFEKSTIAVKKAKNAVIHQNANPSIKSAEVAEVFGNKFFTPLIDFAKHVKARQESRPFVANAELIEGFDKSDTTIMGLVGKIKINDSAVIGRGKAPYYSNPLEIFSIPKYDII